MDVATTEASRDPTLQNFLACLAQAFEVVAVGPEARAALDRIQHAITSVPAAGAPAAEPLRLPVCAHLDPALRRAEQAAKPYAALAEAFRALEPSLAWRPRASGGPFASDNWPDGHANTTILGSMGLEDRDDVIIGASLLAPHVRYPNHNHGPEEVYLVLSPGRFQHGESGWFEPGIGGTLYNEPDIRHAMASDDAPLLAFWCLWVDKAA